MNRAITGATLRELFDTAKIVRDLDCKPPSRAAFDELAGALDLLRISYRSSVFVAKAARKKLQSALEAALEALPAVIDGATQQIRLYREYGWDFLDKATERNKLLQLQDAVLAFTPPPSNIDLEMFPQARDFVMQARDSVMPEVCVEMVVLPFRKEPAWHNFDAELTDYFRAAMRSTNPGLELRMSNEGPIARFLAAVIPLITAEAPSSTAVARHMTRLLAQQEDG